MPDGTTFAGPIGKTPNWLDGYVPPAAEWNAWWAMKLDASDAFVTQGPYLRLAGGTMTGRLILGVEPSNPADAVTKAYVDSFGFAAGPFLPLGGGTMTGRLNLIGAPVTPTEAATKAYVDAGGAGGPFLSLAGGIVTGATSFTGAITLSGGGTITGTYAGNHTMSGTVTHSGLTNLNGNTSIGTSTTTASLAINGAAGQNRNFFFQTAGVNRWSWRADSSAESTVATWTATTAYTLGTLARPNPANGFVYVVQTAGTSGSTQPTWPLTTGTVVDGTVTWAFSAPALADGGSDLILAAYPDAGGGNKGSLLLFDRNGAQSFTPYTINISGTDHGTPGLTMGYAYTGKYTGTTTSNQGITFNRWLVSQDTVTDAEQGIYFAFEGDYGPATTSGGRTGLQVLLKGAGDMTITPGGACSYTGFRSGASSNWDGGGTLTQAGGAIQGMDVISNAMAGGTNWYSNINYQLNLYTATGHNMSFRVGMFGGVQSDAGTQAGRQDAFIACGMNPFGSSTYTSGVPVGAGFRTYIGIGGGGTSAFPIDGYNGSIISATPPIGVAAGMPVMAIQRSFRGIDLSNINMVDGAWLSPGFKIAADGTMRSDRLQVSTGTNGPVIDAPLQVAAITSIASSLGSFKVGEQVYDHIGGVAIVDTLSGTNVTAAHYLYPPRLAAGEVKQVASALIATTANSGDTTIRLRSGTVGIAIGDTVTTAAGVSGVTAGTTVTAFSNAPINTTVTLSAPLTANLPYGTMFLFTQTMPISQVTFRSGSTTSFVANISWTAATEIAVGSATVGTRIVGTSALNGATTVGTATTTAVLSVNGPATSARRLAFSTAASDRWRIQTTAVAESGSNVGSDLDIVAIADNGTTGQTLARLNRATASWTFDPNAFNTSALFTSNIPVVTNRYLKLRGNYALNGGLNGVANASIWTDQTISGTIDGTNPAGSFEINRINATDTATPVGGYQGRLFFNIDYASGPGAAGAATAFSVRNSDTGTGTDRALGAQYQCLAGLFTATVGFNQGGTSLTDVSGAVWGANIVANLRTGATNFSALRGIELNFGVDTGASTTNKSAIKVTQIRDNVSATNGDQFILLGRGALSSAAISQAILCGGRGDVGWSWGINSVLYCSDGYGNDFPSSGVSNQLLGCTISSWTADHSIAFARAYGPFGPLLLDGAACQIGTTRIVPSATGSSIDCAGSYGTGTPTIAVGGTGYVASDRIYYGNGGVCQVISQTGGAVSTIRVLRQPYLTTTTPPANPMATTGDWNTKGTGCTLNVTWNTTANGLSLNPTGQRIGFNGTAPIAKPTVTGAKGSNAALASLVAALVSYGLIIDTTTA